MNKGGWIRIVEATFASIIVLGVLFFLTVRDTGLSEQDLSSLGRSVLDEVAVNQTLRSYVLTDNFVALNDSVATKISQGYLDYEVRICPIQEICGKSVYTPGNVYAAERVISASVNEDIFNPKKVRLFIWRRTP